MECGFYCRMCAILIRKHARRKKRVKMSPTDDKNLRNVALIEEIQESPCRGSYRTGHGFSFPLVLSNFGLSSSS